MGSTKKWFYIVMGNGDGFVGDNPPASEIVTIIPERRDYTMKKNVLK